MWCEISGMGWGYDPSASAKSGVRPARRKGDCPPPLMRRSQATRTRRARRLRDENKNCGVLSWICRQFVEPWCNADAGNRLAFNVNRIPSVESTSDLDKKRTKSLHSESLGCYPIDNTTIRRSNGEQRRTFLWMWWTSLRTVALWVRPQIAC